MTITCSVQRLSLLLAVEEQEKPLTVKGSNIVIKCTSESESGAESVVDGNSVIESPPSKKDISAFKEGVASMKTSILNNRATVSIMMK